MLSADRCITSGRAEIVSAIRMLSKINDKVECGWPAPVTPALGRWKQENWELKVIFHYRATLNQFELGEIPSQKAKTGSGSGDTLL